ncbi:MAG: MFS transporter [Actinomycetota bacterium]
MSDRVALRAVALQFWINGVIFASFIPRLPEIRRQLDLGLDEIGLLLTLGSLGGLVGSAVSAPAVARLGTRWAMTAGAAGLVITLPLIGVAQTPLVFMIGLALLHAFDVVTDVAMNIQGSRLSARRSHPVMSRLHGLWSVGTVFGGLGAVWAAGRVPLDVHLAAVAVVLAVMVLYVSPRLLRSDEVQPEPILDAPGPPAAAGDATVAGPSPREPSPRRSWRASPIGFAVFAVAALAVELIPADWSSLRLSVDVDASETTAGLGYLAVTVGMVVGRFSGDELVVRWGRNGLLLRATVLAGVGMVVAGLAPTSPLALAGFVVVGLGASAMFPQLYDAAASAPGRGSALLSALTAGIRVGAFLLPVTVGWLADQPGLTVGQAMIAVVVPAAIVLGVSAVTGKDAHH